MSSSTTISTTRLPCHQMAVTSDRSFLVLAISSHLQVFDLSTGKLLSSTFNSADPLNPDGSNHTGLIRLLLTHQQVSDSADSLASSSDPQPTTTTTPPRSLLISTGEDKLLKTWELPSLKLINSRELIKRATSIAISPNRQNIVIADKFGDVYDLPFDAPSQTIFQSDPDQEAPIPPTSSSKDDPKSDSKTRVGKTLVPIAGHVSVLTSLTFIPSQSNGSLLVTADRDEHIRISRYPQAWSIVSYLLGHRKFVAALLWVPNYDSQSCPHDGRLLSGGGDPDLFVWDHTKKMCTKRIDVNRLADGLKVWPHKQAWFSKTRSNKRQRQNLEQKQKTPNDDDNKNDNDDPTPSNPSKGGPESDSIPPSHSDLAKEPQPVAGQRICINKIICTPPSARAGSGYVLVTSVGSSILAAIPLPAIFDSSSDGQDQTQYHDLGLPILDIVPLSDQHILVSLDTSFSDPSAPAPSFRILELTPLKMEELADLSAFNLSSLNETASGAELGEVTMPSQEALYPELLLFTKDDQSATLSRGQAHQHEFAASDKGGRSGKKEEGRQLSQKRCEIVLAQVAISQ